MVMEKNRIELGSKKPPKFPRETKDENHKRKVVSNYIAQEKMYFSSHWFNIPSKH